MPGTLVLFLFFLFFFYSFLSPVFLGLGAVGWYLVPGTWDLGVCFQGSVGIVRPHGLDRGWIIYITFWRGSNGNWALVLFVSLQGFCGVPKVPELQLFVC
jgi:hypothetical protein